MVFVRGPEHSNIQHFVEKVVFHLHESFPKPKRGEFARIHRTKWRSLDTPASSCRLKFTSGIRKSRRKSASTTTSSSTWRATRLSITSAAKNSPSTIPRKSFGASYSEPEGNGIRTNAPRTTQKQVMVMQEGSTSLFGPHMKLPSLPNSSLASATSDPRKSKSSHGPKDGSKGSGPTLLTTATTTSTNSSSFSKLHKPSKDHKEKPPKDLKETKSAFRDSCWEPSKAPKEPARKPKENQPLRNSNPKMGFKEPKSLSHRSEVSSHGANKRPSAPDGDNHVTKKRKRGFRDLPGKLTSESDVQHSDKKLLKDRQQMQSSKLHLEGDEAAHRKTSKLATFQEVVDPNDSDMESTKSDSEQPSPASSSSSSGFAPTHHKRQVVDLIIRKRVAIPDATHTVLGPLQSVMQDLHSDDHDDHSEEDDDLDLDSDAERPAHTHLAHHQRRVTLSDGSESDSSAPSPPSRHDVTGLLKSTSNQILEVKSPNKQSKLDKNQNLDCDKAYLDELVELHKRLMTLREGHILQQRRPLHLFANGPFQAIGSQSDLFAESALPLFSRLSTSLRRRATSTSQTPLLTLTCAPWTEVQ
ncbi:protein AF-9 isoform X9 [Festucalex cinctus]